MASKLEQLLSDIKSGLRPTKVDLSNEGLDALPIEVLSLADCLEFLNMGGNNLCDLPQDIVKLSKLKIMFFAQNRFTEVPEQLGQLPCLRMLSFKSNRLEILSEASLSPSIEWLILTDNQIPELPKAIGKLTGLKKLLLAGNKLSCLPDEMANCKQLELVRLASNRLSSLPQWLVELPRLSWIAFAGNTDHLPEQHTKASVLPWEEVVLLEKLGEGASGTVYRVALPALGDADTDYALKLFKGDVTSDGLAEDEIKVNESVGDHPCFIRVISRVSDHPDGLPALLLPLLPAAQYSILGNPPSFDSITRDTFADNTSFTTPFALNVLKRIASAAQHLRSLGIVHGDLYAHNVLTTTAGEALLTDFGAAWFSACSGCDDKYLERIEVRAFGCLLDDLLNRLGTCDEQTNAARPTLESLRSRCLDPVVLSRPTFDEIVTVLESM